MPVWFAACKLMGLVGVISSIPRTFTLINKVFVLKSTAKTVDACFYLSKLSTIIGNIEMIILAMKNI